MSAMHDLNAGRRWPTVIAILFGCATFPLKRRPADAPCASQSRPIRALELELAGAAIRA